MIRDFKVIETVLHTGDTSVSITNSYINDNSVIEIYTDNYMVFPTNISQSNETLNISFDKQLSDINIKIVINNIEDTLDVPEKISDLSDYDTSVQLQTGYGLYWNGVKWQPGIMYEEYNNLINKPKINNVVLSGGNNSAESLGLATIDDLSTKQDTLTPGANINIVDNVISSTGGSTDIELTKTQYDAIGDEKLTNGINYFIKDWSQSIESFSVELINGTSSASGNFNTNINSNEYYCFFTSVDTNYVITSYVNANGMYILRIFDDMGNTGTAQGSKSFKAIVLKIKR